MSHPQPSPVQRTQAVDQLDFESLFKSHFKGLLAYAFSFLKNEANAEEMVQQVFYKLWDRRERIDIDSSVTAYLYRAIHHECLNHLRHQQVRQAHQKQTLHTTQHTHTHPEDRLKHRELQKKLDEALQKLPQQCRTIFHLSRFEHLKYQEIAQRLHISPKTVENQMGKALRILRNALADYLAIWFWAFILLTHIILKP